MFAGTKRVDQICLAISAALFAFFLFAPVASAQCNPGRVFDERNLSLGQALATGTLACQDGKCNLPSPSGSSGPAAAEASSVAKIQELQAAVNQLQAMLSGAGSGTTAIARAGGAKPLRMSQHGSSEATAYAEAGGGYAEPQPMPQAPDFGALSQAQATPAPVIPVALLANASSASSASSVASNSCNSCDRRGLFRRASRTRSRTRTTSNGNTTTSSARSVSR